MGKRKRMEWWKHKYIVAKIFVKYVYLQLLQKLYKTVLHVHKNKYEIQYVLHDTIYKVRTQVQRGPSKIILIKDQHGNDITNDMRCYLGPNEDFHGQLTTPTNLGYEKIYIQLRNGQELEFDAHAIIVF